MIALGLFTFLYLAVRHPRRKKIMSAETFYEVGFVGLALGIVGGRLLFAIMAPEIYAGHWHEVLFPWQGGFSLLGTIIAVVGGLPLYFRRRGVPILPTLDLAAIYAPLLQSISRIGCFLAGCCYGSACNLAWAVRYTHPDSLAPLGVFLHPTQLYSSLASFTIFIVMRFALDARLKKPGQLIFSYLCLEGLARFTVDFWRSDQTGAYQLLALGIFGVGCLGLLVVYLRKKP